MNLILLVAVVFLGIQQASCGADISSLEDKLETVVNSKMELSENLFRNDSESNLDLNATELGFVKPSNVLYFNSIGTVASK